MPDSMNEVELINTLPKISLFGSLDATQLSQIINACEQQEVQPGSILCHSHTVDDRLFILLTGKLRLESAEGIKLAEITPLRVLGEMGVFTEQPRSSRVVVEETSTVLELGKDDIEKLAEEDPEMEFSLLISLIKLLYDRTHEMNEETESLRRQVDLFRTRLEELVPNDPLLADLSPPDAIDS